MPAFTLRRIGTLAVVLWLGAGCSAGAKQNTGALAATGAGGVGVPTAGDGSAGMQAGAAGVTAGTSAAGVTGAAGTASAGAGGVSAGSAGAAGVSGAAGSAGAAAGTGGAGGAGGSGGGIMRGPDPTEASASAAGPYAVQMYTSGFKTPMTYGAATIYYPMAADAPFAMVVICPGYLSVQSSIAAWGPFFASHGIVTMTIDTKTTGDSVVMRSDEIMEALDGLKAENARSGSPLMGKLDVMRVGVMGWSMGGGGTWIDASKHPELRSALSLAGHDSSAGGPSSSPNIMVPTFLCAGQSDTMLLGGMMSQPVYASIPDATPKMLYEITGGSHSICNTPTSAGNALGRYGLSWQKVFLEGDLRYKQFLLKMPPMASDFKTNLK